MVGFHRTFSMLLHLWEMAEILRVFAKFGPNSKKIKGTRQSCSSRSHGYMPDGRSVRWRVLISKRTRLGRGSQSRPACPGRLGVDGNQRRSWEAKAQLLDLLWPQGRTACDVKDAPAR